MTSVKPYFVQALHEWITDNGLTPLVVIDASYPGVRVPEGAIEDGKVTLNVSYDAAENIQMDDELMTFNARFGGVSHAVLVPMESITAIYARENGKGMMFDVDHDEADAQAADEAAETSTEKSSKPHLKLVD